MAVDVASFLSMMPALQQHDHVRLHYDSAGDILYVNFADEPTDDSDMTDDDILIRYDSRGQVIGYTIFDVSKR